MYAPSVCEGRNNSRHPVHFKASTRYLSCFLSRKPCYQEMLLDGRFFLYLLVQFWWYNRRLGFTVRFTTSGMFLFFPLLTAHNIHSIITQIQTYFAKSVFLSLLHQLGFTIRGQSTNSFLRCGPLVARKGCIKGPSDVWTVKTTKASQRTSGKYLITRSYYNDFQWHQFDLKY